MNKYVNLEIEEAYKNLPDIKAFTNSTILVTGEQA